MRLEKIDLGEMSNYFSPIFLDYIEGNKSINPFYKYTPKLKSFEQAIGQRKGFSQETRELLHKVLTKQYENLPEKHQVSVNIDSLKAPKTFTVTTGHQLNIFTGPLYFIYKIVTVINTCKVLSEQYPDYRFVPVYWMASEDHDFEEINHFELFGKTYRWETTQKGPVGRFSTDSIQALLSDLPEHVPLFEEAYKKNKTLAAATRDYVHALFGEEGLVVVDADDPDLKRTFLPVIKDDILHHQANTLVENCNAALEANHYKGQIFPRKINFFYMENGLRERIVKEDNHYEVLNTDLSFSEEELLALIDSHPGKFSPNVVLRPLYQETILPNLAYIGGPAEVAYWLQLKTVFEHYETFFPILMPRNFAVIINKTNCKRLEKLALPYKDLFLPFHELKQKFIDKNVENGYHLEEERETVEAIYAAIKAKAVSKDKSLEGFVGAEAAKAMKGIENIVKRLQRAEERNQEVAIHQLEGLKEKLFPGGGLQERKENILNFYINTPEIIRHLLLYLDPFDFKFNVIMEDE